MCREGVREAAATKDRDRKWEPQRYGGSAWGRERGTSRGCREGNDVMVV